MIPIAGTVRNSIKLAQLDAKWQQKKMNPLQQKKKELTIEERQIQMYQQDVEQMRKSNWIAELMNKLKAGELLTEEERQYLEQNNPQALKEYEDVKRERAAYKEELKKCKSKEEAEQLKMNKMNEFMSAAKAVDSNPNIPKAAKIGLMERIMRRLAGIEEEHAKFTKSLRYQKLPDRTYDITDVETTAADKTDDKTAGNTSDVDTADTDATEGRQTAEVNLQEPPTGMPISHANMSDSRMPESTMPEKEEEYT